MPMAVPTVPAMVDPAKRFSIEGKSVIVTGASGAMGSEAAKALGAAGANVTLAGEIGRAHV